MRVFVTGASGWIGSAVVPELLGAGHEVVGLARSDASADALTPPARRSSAAPSTTSTSCATPPRRPTASSTSRSSTSRRSRATSRPPPPPTAPRSRPSARRWRARTGRSSSPRGSPASAPGTIATEDDEATGGNDRARSEQAVLALAGSGVRSVSVRLAPTTHGEGDNGFMTFIVGAAREKGVAGYIGDGTNHWTAVHRSDAARLFRLAVERAPAGSVLHAAGETGVPQRDIAAAIGRGLDLDGHLGRARRTPPSTSAGWAPS